VKVSKKISIFNLASKRLINIDSVENSFAFALHFTKTIILNFISHLQYVLYLNHLSHLYYIMSDVKHHVNAKTYGGNI